MQASSPHAVMQEPFLSGSRTPPPRRAPCTIQPSLAKHNFTSVHSPRGKPVPIEGAAPSLHPSLRLPEPPRLQSENLRNMIVSPRLEIPPLPASASCPVGNPVVMDSPRMQCVPSRSFFPYPSSQPIPTMPRSVSFSSSASRLTEVARRRSSSQGTSARFQGSFVAPAIPSSISCAPALPSSISCPSGRHFVLESPGRSPSPGSSSCSPPKPVGLTSVLPRTSSLTRLGLGVARPCSPSTAGLPSAYQVQAQLEHTLGRPGAIATPRQTSSLVRYQGQVSGVERFEGGQAAPQSYSTLLRQNAAVVVSGSRKLLPTKDALARGNVVGEIDQTQFCSSCDITSSVDMSVSDDGSRAQRPCVKIALEKWPTQESLDIIHEVFVSIERNRIPCTANQWNAEEARQFGTKLLSRFSLDRVSWPLSTWAGLYRGVLQASNGFDQPPNEDIAGHFARCVLEQVALSEDMEEARQLAKAYSFGSLGSLSSEAAVTGPTTAITLKRSSAAVRTAQAPRIIADASSSPQTRLTTSTPFRADSTYSHFGSCLGHKVLLEAQKKTAWRGRLDVRSKESILENRIHPEAEAKSSVRGVPVSLPSAPATSTMDEARDMSENDPPTLLYSPESSPTVCLEDNTGRKCDRERLEGSSNASLQEELIRLRASLGHERSENTAAWQSLANFLNHMSVLPKSPTGDTGSDSVWRSDADGAAPLSSDETCEQLRKKVLASFMASCSASTTLDGRCVEQQARADNSLLSSIGWEDCVTTLAFPGREQEPEISLCSSDGVGMNRTNHNAELAVARATLAELGCDSLQSLPDSLQEDLSFYSNATSHDEMLGLQAVASDVNSELAFYQQALWALDKQQQHLLSKVRRRDEEVSQLRQAEAQMRGTALM